MPVSITHVSLQSSKHDGIKLSQFISDGKSRWSMSCSDSTSITSFNFKTLAEMAVFLERCHDFVMDQLEG